MGLVVRDDLSQRTSLSKSSLTTFDVCATAAWHDIHHRLPLIPAERITFGSAVDAGVEAVVKFLRMEQEPDLDVCLAAASEVIARDETGVELSEVGVALTRFLSDVAPSFDFRYAKTQEHITGELPDLGEVDGHPDIWLADGRIFDVKTAKREKAAEPTVELGFYAVIGEAYSGSPVPSVGYWTWTRTSRPHWQLLEFPVTDQLRRWTIEKAAAFIRAKRADAILNRDAETPVNFTMTGGPKFGCDNCAYRPICSIATIEASDDDAA